jgi:hypothetical protein
MKDDFEGLICGRESELISFLYGELKDTELETFRGHMNDCASCSKQLATLAYVRESVSAWRNETLGGVASFAQPAAIDKAYRDQPSALLALREFFSLSPLWMRGAVVFASLLFCLLTVLVVARFREPASAPLVATPNNRSSSAEFDAAVERRVQEELKRIQAEAATTTTIEAMAPRDAIVRGDKAKRSGEVASSSNLPKARRPLTRVEREELAADLRLIAGPNDSELELLADGNNQ